VTTVEEQIGLMAGRYGRQFKLVYKNWWTARWEGAVVGLDRSYRVAITYYRWRDLDHFQIRNRRIEVVVLEPPVCRRTEEPDEPIPHIYGTVNGEQPVLCLYDPAANDWDRDDSIADAIVPWVAEWLMFYELWHATGKWTGPGRHPGEPVTREARRLEKPCLESTSDAPLGHSPRGEFRYLGPLTASFESSQSTAAASEASCPPGSLRASKNGIWTTETSPTALTLLLEPLPEAFSLSD
jgi:hypothetical protein